MGRPQANRAAAGDVAAAASRCTKAAARCLVVEGPTA